MDHERHAQIDFLHNRLPDLISLMGWPKKRKEKNLKGMVNVVCSPSFVSFNGELSKLSYKTNVRAGQI